jgi:nucleoside-diphosphate-sugar epimerase
LRLLCGRLALPFPQRRVPFRVAFAAASAMEALYMRMPTLGEPPLTRYTVSLLACSMTLSVAAAQIDLDYRPRVTVDEGIERFVEWRRTVERSLGK